MKKRWWAGPLGRVAAVALALVALLVGVPVLVLATAVQPEPAVAIQPDPAVDDIARAVALVRTHDPRNSAPGRISAISLSERDLDVLLNHAAHRYLPATSQVSLRRGSATVRSSVHLPANPFGRWLNVELQLQETGGLPVLTAWQVGRLPLPAWLGERLLRWAAQRAGLGEELAMSAEVVRRVGFSPQQLAVVYAWRGDSADRLLGALVPAPQQLRLRAYAEQLARVVAGQGPGWTVSLAPLVGPLFELARQRSAAPDSDAAAENRAAIVVLTLFANGRGLEAVLPAANGWARARPLQVTLGGRDDFPRHWLISAALAAEGTTPLSRAIGVYKEVADSRGGSGFSFNDMAANRAGTRVGELAVAQPARLQALLAAGVQEADLMPAWADLPEGMPEPEFQRRYGGVGAPAYEAMLAEIERRVSALPVLR